MLLYEMPTAHIILLHGFSDASTQAYGMVVYLRTIYQDGKTSSVIVVSKTRVAPVRVQMIPRLELFVAVILTRLVVTLRKSLESLMNLTTYYWTDSTVIFHWINNCRPWKHYVNHRVTEIRRYSSPEEWNHCPGVCNPADMPSRGLTGRELMDSKCWWNGPEFFRMAKCASFR